MSGRDQGGPKKKGGDESKKAPVGRRGAGRSRAAAADEGTVVGAMAGLRVGETTQAAATGEAGQSEVGVRGRSGGRAPGEQRDGSDSGSSPTERHSPPDDSPEREKGAGDAARVKQSVALAARPPVGSAGKKFMVYANHFEVDIGWELVVHQYVVDITHARIKLNRDLKRIIFWQGVRENPQVFGNVAYKIVYDGDKLCITLESIKFPSNTAEPGTLTLDVNLSIPRFDRPEPMRLKLQLVGALHVSLKNVNTIGGVNDRYTTPLNILDILFRQQRTCPLVEASKAWYPFGSTVYSVPPNPTQVPGLGLGQCIWQGLFGSMRAGQIERSFINFDVAHSGFYRPQNAIDFMVDVMNSKFGRGFSRDQLNSQSRLQPQHVQALNKEFKGVFVSMMVKGKNGAEFERQYRVNSVVPTSAVDSFFDRRRDDGTMERVSVAQHFKERYGDLRYPLLNLLSAGGGKRIAQLPLEHCRIVSCQRVSKKLTPDQTSEMIKVAAIGAPNRMQRINQLVAQSNFAQDPWLKQFGVRVNQSMKQVEARLLPSFKIEYSQGRTANVALDKGSWDSRQQKFYIPAGCQRVAALVLDDARDLSMFERFFAFLFNVCRDFGMNLPQSIPRNLIEQLSPSRAAAEIERSMKKFKDMGVELVIVVVPQKGSPLYSEVKRAAEVVWGLMTQCVTRQTVNKTNERQDRMTAGNIALKINAKLGGVNWKAQADAFAQKTLQEAPTLVLGVDVTHPAPTERRAPSVVSVVGNLDNTFMQYAASVRVQKHRRESIFYLQEPTKERIMEYFKYGNDRNEERRKRGQQPLPLAKPRRIIIYRDGVAENQFQEVLATELVNMRQACQELDPSYKPSITFIVGQKRHHTRFFPMSKDTACGRGDNVYPGTVVDKTIVHPTYFEFYLCSHFGIQGTSRPIRYHVLTDDNAFTSDHIQMMTYYLSHCFSRCTRPVSLPAPLYYADLACRRARVHLYDKISDFSSDTMSQSGTGTGTGESAISEDELNKGSTVAPPLKMTMYFT